jgi:predicted metal-dependent peptidase
MAAPAPTVSRRLTVRDTIDKARWHATKKFPYLSRALFAATFVETDKVPTMAVDKRFRVYFNPAHIRECELESFDAVIEGVVHEILHPTLRHETRARASHAADHAHWNRCGDCELVQSIRAAGIKLWSKGLTPEKMGWPEDLTAEEYYKLPRDQDPRGNPTCSGGSGAGGNPGPWELTPGEAGPAGLSDTEADVLRAVVAQAIREHAERKGRGSVPGGMLRWAESMLAPPTIDWKAMIAARVRYHIDSRLGPVASYARPSRRDAGGLVLPVHRSPRANVVIVGDTSGSMGDTDIGKVLGVVHEAVLALGVIKALGCDSAAVDPVEIHHIDDLREALKGGGGTNMAAGIERAARDNPDAIVVVTDGDTDWPDDPPESPVVIVLTRQTRCAVPTWADVIDASDIANETPDT